MLSLWNRTFAFAGSSSKRARKLSALSMAYLTSDWRRARSRWREALSASRSCGREGWRRGGIGRVGGEEWGLWLGVFLWYFYLLRRCLRFRYLLASWWHRHLPGCGRGVRRFAKGPGL